MKSELTVENNKSVSIKGIYQWPTYGGLLEGLPVERINSNIIQNARYTAKRHTGNQTLFMIEPISTPIPYEGIYPFGTPTALPNIICVADLSVAQPARDMNKQGSALTVMWFQNDYAFPIDNDILEKIKEIPWSQLADDFDY